ncbi:hypothetical protein IJZ97_04925 [bacterium]|nr:hypothetical protein [bacterium]
MLTNTYITIQFDRLEPFEANMPLYYKGFRVGRTRSIKPSKDFKHTLISAVIEYSDLKLPKNTTAIVKKRDKGEYHKDLDYIELEYPDSPSIVFLKNGSIIKGSSAIDWNTLFSQQASDGKLDGLGQSVTDLMDNLNEAVETLSMVFTTIDDLLQENRPNLLAASTNLANTTTNFYDVSSRMSNSLSQERFDNTTGGIENTSQNFDDTSKSIKEIADNFNQMMPYVDATIVDLNSTMCNINQISAGILQTLKKRMGLLRLLVGKPVK